MRSRNFRTPFGLKTSSGATLRRDVANAVLSGTHERCRVRARGGQSLAAPRQGVRRSLVADVSMAPHSTRAGLPYSPVEPRDEPVVWTVLTDSARRRVASSLPRRCRLRSISSIALLAEELSCAFGDLIILDSGLVRTDLMEALLETIKWSGARLLLYSPLNRTTAREARLIASRMPVAVIFEGADDESTILAAHLHSFREPTVPSLVLARLDSCISNVDPVLQPVLVGLLGWQPIPKSVTALLHPLGNRRRSFERSVWRAGFVGLAPILACARLARAWNAAMPLETVQAVADRVAFDAQRTMTDHFRRFVGLPPHRAWSELTPETFADRLASFVLR